MISGAPQRACHVLHTKEEHCAFLDELSAPQRPRLPRPGLRRGDLILGTSVGASAGTRLVADDGLPDIVKPKDPATGSIEPGVIVPGHKVTWTWDDQD